jgi:hypothetical protein
MVKEASLKLDIEIRVVLMLDGRVEARLYDRLDARGDPVISRVTGTPLFTFAQWDDFCVQVFKRLDGYFPGGQFQIQERLDY